MRLKTRLFIALFPLLPIVILSTSAQEAPRSIAQKPTEIPPSAYREAKQSIGTLNRAQQAYYLENDRFTTNLEATGVGIKPDGADYRVCSLRPIATPQPSKWPYLKPPTSQPLSDSSTPQN